MRARASNLLPLKQRWIRYYGGSLVPSRCFTQMGLAAAQLRTSTTPAPFGVAYERCEHGTAGLAGVSSRPSQASVRESKQVRPRMAHYAILSPFTDLTHLMSERHMPARWPAALCASVDGFISHLGRILCGEERCAIRAIPETNGDERL